MSKEPKSEAQRAFKERAKEERRARKEAKREKKRSAEEVVNGSTEPVEALEAQTDALTEESKKSKKSKKRKLEDEPEEESEKSKKSKKRKRDEDVVEEVKEYNAEETHKAKKSKKGNKDKKDESQGNEALSGKEPVESSTSNGAPLAEDDVSLPKEPTKKELKELKRKARRYAEAPSVPADGAPNGDATEEAEVDPNAPASKHQRFIVFIGNLPFSATKDSIAKHFSKVSPTSIRLMTHKDSGKSKGYAFMDFDHYDRMKTCLKLYHHSNFDDGVSSARKINVELTAGGGGNNETRKSKLAAKNTKLNGQRKRRVMEEEKKKNRHEAKEQKKQQGAKGKGKGKPLGLDDTTNMPTEASVAKRDTHAGIHPSRLARLQF